MTKVSIITPAYNAEQFIAETIESVLKQTFTSWEMIIVDDCSTDETFKIVENYSKRDVRIKGMKNKVNSGVAQTRNVGLSVATGRYITFLDSDDIWLPKKLEKQIGYMEANNVAFSYSKYQKYISETKSNGKIIDVPNIMTAKKLLGNTAIGCLTVMVDREKTGDFCMPLLEHGEDTCTWYSILSKGFVAHGIQEVLALYRVSNNSLSRSKKKAVKQQWTVYRTYYKFPFIKSLWYFSKYIVNATRKHF